MKAMTILLLNFFSVAAHASTCQFLSRSELGPLAKDLPAAAIGWVTCAERAPEASLFVVSKFDGLDEALLETYSKKIAAQMDSMTRSTQLTWRSPQPIEKRQWMLKTTGPRVNDLEPDVMSHYFFVAAATDGSKLIFSHSLDESASQKIRKTLENLRQELSASTFTNQILRASVER